MQKAKCNSNNFNQIPQFIAGDIVWDTNPVIFLIVYQLLGLVKAMQSP